MDRITRKSLKDDRFASELTHSVEYVAGHRGQFLLWGGTAAGVILLAAGIFFYRQNRQRAAHLALFDAMETIHAYVGNEQRLGVVAFRTEHDRDTKALQQFQEVANKYRGTPEAEIARYYLGVVENNMGQTAEAQKQLQGLINSGEDNIKALARMTLAEIDLAQGKNEEAQKIFDYLLQHPTDTVPKARVQIAMARSLQMDKPEEARKLLLDLEKQPGPVAAAAGTLLRELGQ